MIAYLFQLFFNASVFGDRGFQMLDVRPLNYWCLPLPTIINPYSCSISGSGSKPRCPVYASPWTECSKTCGVGIATRIKGDEKCEMKYESKLCVIQHCDEER